MKPFWYYKKLTPKRKWRFRPRLHRKKPEHFVASKGDVVIRGVALTKSEINKVHYPLNRKGKPRLYRHISHEEHNPNKFTAEQYGKERGYRLLNKDEIC